MKKLLLLPLILMCACTSPSDVKSKDNYEEAKSTIISKLESDGLGMIKDFEITALKAIDSVNYNATYVFTNPLVGKKIKLERLFTFSDTNTDSILSVEDVSSLMEKNGEWIEMTLENMFEALE